MLGSLIGGLIVVVNLRNLFYGGDGAEPTGIATAILAGTVLAWICAVAWSAREHLRTARADVAG
jgi:hypothetical protein